MGQRSRSQRDPTTAKMYLDIFNRLGVNHDSRVWQTDRRTDGQTEPPLAIALPTCAKNRNKNSLKTCFQPFVHWQRFFSRIACWHEIIELLRQGLHTPAWTCGFATIMTSIMWISGYGNHTKVLIRNHWGVWMYR